MNMIHMKIDVRVPENMYNFMINDANLMKLSFEGLVLLYIKERMEREKGK